MATHQAPGHRLWLGQCVLVMCWISISSKYETQPNSHSFRVFWWFQAAAKWKRLQFTGWSVFFARTMLSWVAVGLYDCIGICGKNSISICRAIDHVWCQAFRGLHRDTAHWNLICSLGILSRAQAEQTYFQVPSYINVLCIRSMYSYMWMYIYIHVQTTLHGYICVVDLSFDHIKFICCNTSTNDMLFDVYLDQACAAQLVPPGMLTAVSWQILVAKGG